MAYSLCNVKRNPHDQSTSANQFLLTSQSAKSIRDMLANSVAYTASKTGTACRRQAQ